MRYVSDAGARLVTQGSSPAPAGCRVITRPEAELEELIARALVSGVCSVCSAPSDRRSLDASGRCQECQP